MTLAQGSFLKSLLFTVSYHSTFCMEFTDMNIPFIRSQRAVISITFVSYLLRKGFNLVGCVRSLARDRDKQASYTYCVHKHMIASLSELHLQF